MPGKENTIMATLKTVKEYQKEYLKKGSYTKTMYFRGEPIKHCIYEELDFTDEEIGDLPVQRYQFSTIADEDEKILAVILGGKQLKEYFGEYDDHKHETKYATGEKMDTCFSCFDCSKTSKPPVGYCHNPKHKGFVNIGLMKSHNCIANQCMYFERFETHEYWINRKMRIDKKKADKKARKAWLEGSEK